LTFARLSEVNEILDIVIGLDSIILNCEMLVTRTLSMTQMTVEDSCLGLCEFSRW